MRPESLRLLCRQGFMLAALSFAAGCGAQEASNAGSRSVSATDGVSLAYEVHGEQRSDAPTLVLIHGWSCDRGYWDAQVGPFAERYRVVTLDLAGHGDSGFGRENWTIASYGADVASVVEELDLERVVLVGHSMGGDVAVDAARLVPERVTAMIWIDTYRQLGNPRTPEQIEAFVAPLRTDFVANTYAFVHRNLFHPEADSTLVERVATDMSQAPPEVAIPSIESSFANGRVVPRVVEEGLGLPVIAINPDDGSTDIAAMERYGVEVVLMPDVGHFLMMEAPDRFNEILIGVVEGLGR